MEYLILLFVALLFFLAGYFFYELIFSVSVQDLSGKHVVVTGGSSGIGKSVAIKAAQLGAHVTIIARDVTKLENVKKLIVESCVHPANQKVTALSMDVTQAYELTERSLHELEDSVGPVFMFVNCAGSAECATFEKSTEDNYRRMTNLNLLGTVLPTKAISQKMVKREEGIIVITASQAALLGIYGLGAYCSSKWALRGFAETLYHELAPHNVSVTLCLPPDTDTPGLENENKDKPEETKLICQTGGLAAPDNVAQKLLSDALKRHFWSTVGIDGVLLTLGCSGFSPLSSFPEVFLQILMASFVRFISIFHLRNMAAIINSRHVQRKKQNILKTEMGGDHHHKFPKIPDWRSYKVEDAPELVRIQRALASIGLKDPWLRNEVWRFDRRIWGTPGQRIKTYLFRGFKWGLLAAVITFGIEKALTPAHHGHGHEEHH